MIKRDFGKRCGFKVPAINIGGMRLPEDIDEAVAVIRHAINSGMIYIDTSRGYGDSEIKIGQALKNGYRQKIILSTKWSPWIQMVETSDNTSADCTRKRIDESMKRLDVDYLDFYQVWNIDSREHYQQAIAKGGMLDGIQKAMKEGLVGHTGFTTHDSVENLKSYFAEVDWCEICLFTYNILNERYGPAIEAAHQRGIGTVIMNPVAGGMLNNPNPALQALADQVGARSIPDLGLRTLISNSNIDCVVSGINKKSDVDNSVAAANADAFCAESLAKISVHLQNVLNEKQAFCTGCKYCVPCPQEIDIPQVMHLIAQYRFSGFQQLARKSYAEMKTPRADACAQCRQCEEKCTQHLKIVEEMAYLRDEWK